MNVEPTDLKPLYYIVGSLVLANVGTIVSVWIFSIKATFKVASFVKDLQHAIKEAKDTGVRAHKRIDKIEDVRGL